jgi:hypothetical protein
MAITSRVCFVIAAGSEIRTYLPERLSKLKSIQGDSSMQITERRGTLTGIAMKDGIALSRALKSNSPLPLAGVAAAVKAGDNEKGIGLDEKKERVGKFLRGES